MALTINATGIDTAVAATAVGAERTGPAANRKQTAETRGDAAPASDTASALLGRTPEQIVSGNNTVEVSFDDSIRRVVIKVKSEPDGEVVKQIPPEEYQRFLAKLKEMIGVIFDQKA